MVSLVDAFYSQRVNALDAEVFIMAAACEHEVVNETTLCDFSRKFFYTGCLSIDGNHESLFVR